MSWHPKTDERLARMQRFDAAAGDKYCWASLAMLAMTKDSPGDELESRKESCRGVGQCKDESAQVGSCWCTKFIDGEFNRRASNE